MVKTLRFRVDAAYEHLKRDHSNLTKRQLVTHILHQYESRGHAMRCLDRGGKITWKARPRLADAERDAREREP